MKQIQPVTGYILSGEDKFYPTADAAKTASVRAERLRMIRAGVGNKWYSDPIAALIDNTDLLQAVALLKYTDESL